MPGMAMSRIRHLVSSTQSEERNSSAEENTRAAKPNSLSRSGNDSRTDSSSSTTDRSGGTLPPLPLRDSMTKQCDIPRGTSIVLRYWFGTDADRRQLSILRG